MIRNTGQGWKEIGDNGKKEERTMETIKEEEKEIEQENLGLREWTEKDYNKIGNICDLYYEL